MFGGELCSTYGSCVRLNIVVRHGWSCSVFSFATKFPSLFVKNLPCSNLLIADTLNETILHLDAPLPRIKRPSKPRKRRIFFAMNGEERQVFVWAYQRFLPTIFSIFAVGNILAIIILSDGFLFLFELNGKSISQS